CMQGSHFPPTF
nr:immunoglobulin light chain junction region [Macaca mulatta]